MHKKDKVLFSPQIETFTPFACTVDPSRLNMASKQQLQVVISSDNETPFIIDKHYKKVTEVNSPFAEFAAEDGHVLLSDAETLIVYYPNQKKMITKSTPPYKKLINNSLSLKYRAGVGAIKKGELLLDYTGMDPVTSLPKIGYRARILFSSFFGYTSDDAMVVSESFAAKAKIEYSQKVFIPITKEWKYLRNHLDRYFYDLDQQLDGEAYAQYFNIDAGEHFMAEIHNISEQQSMFFTKNIPGIKKGIPVSIKVHPNTDKSFRELKEKYMYTPGLIDEIEYFSKRNNRIKQSADQIFDQLGIDHEKRESLVNELSSSHYEQVGLNKAFESKLKDEFNLDPANVDFLLEVTVAYKTKTTRGDKFTNIFAGKGTVAMIIPDEVMPIDPESGKPIEIVFNPLGIFGRNNWGVIFELAISKVADDVERLAKDAIVDGELVQNKVDGILERIAFIEENFISKIDKEYSDSIKSLLKAINDEMALEEYHVVLELIEDIKAKGFFLYVQNFPGITWNDFYTSFIGPYHEKFGVNFGKTKIDIDKKLIKWLREKWHYKNDVLGDEIYDTSIEAFVGSNYMLKLYHTSYSKFTAVSLANSYSKITGQPARGRKKVGGQHLSWQSLAALLGHRERNGVLKELYTIKSDAPIKDKEKFLMQYITTGKYNLKPKYVSLTKRAVNNALKILGMHFEDEN